MFDAFICSMQVVVVGGITTCFSRIAGKRRRAEPPIFQYLLTIEEDTMGLFQWQLQVPPRSPAQKGITTGFRLWRKYVTCNWQSSRGVSSWSGWIEECYPDEKETRGSIIHHRRFSSNFNTFLRNLSVPATSIISVVSLVADRCHWCHTAPISSNLIRVKGGVGQVSLEEHIYGACVTYVKWFGLKYCIPLWIEVVPS